jgi:hypothetical protein
VRSLDAALAALYGTGGREGLRLTDGGLWHATPLSVLAAAIPVLEKTGLVTSPRILFDAGAGDGRLLAALALGLPGAAERRLLGLECDPVLAGEAGSRLEALGARLPVSRLPRVAEGDFFQERAYAPLAVSPSDLDLVFNYPDGNERRLLRWLARHGKRGSRLLILSPDREPSLGPAPLLRREVRPRESAVVWSLDVYAPT